LIDEAYLRDGSSNNEVRLKYDYLSHEQWLCLFKDSSLRLVEEISSSEDYDFDHENKVIAARADELIAKYPEKRAVFEGYIQSQLNECADLKNTVIGATWMLQRLLRSILMSINRMLF